MKKNLAVILAGGTGTRIEGRSPKQFIEIGGKAVIAHAVERFEEHPAVDDIFIVTHPGFYDRTLEMVQNHGYRKVARVLEGGETRQESSRIGVLAGGDDYENVLIHDAARPFVSPEMIDVLVEKLEEYDALCAALPSPDTVVRVDEKNLLVEVPDRAFLRRVQTPQAFKLRLIREAHLLARENKIAGASDDCSLVLRSGLADILVVEGNDLNIKITYPFDIRMAEEILKLETQKRGRGG